MAAGQGGGVGREVLHHPMFRGTEYRWIQGASPAPPQGSDTPSRLWAGAVGCLRGAGWRE